MSFSPTPSENKTDTKQKLLDIHNKLITAFAKFDASADTLSESMDKALKDSEEPSLYDEVEDIKKEMAVLRDCIKEFIQVSGSYLQTFKEDLEDEISIQSSTMELVNGPLGFTEGNAIVLKTEVILSEMHCIEPAHAYLEQDRVIRTYKVPSKSRTEERFLAILYGITMNFPACYENGIPYPALRFSFTMPDVQHSKTGGTTVNIGGFVDMSLFVFPKDPSISRDDLEDPDTVTSLARGAIIAGLSGPANDKSFDSDQVARAVCGALATYELYKSRRFFLSDGQFYQFGLLDVKNKVYHLSKKLDVEALDDTRTILTVMGEWIWEVETDHSKRGLWEVSKV